jgi:uncharacterized protein (TIGR03792 family)
MVIEWLKLRVSPELREKFIQKDAEIWTSKLASYPGFLSKEVWINPETPTELDHRSFVGQAGKQWQAIPSEELVQTEKQFNQEFGEQHQIIEAAEYQVRKFPLMRQARTRRTLCG